MISIIVPVYNTSKYLKTCIDSILSQTFTDFELLLIDDGSTDNSWEICCEYQEKDGRVRAICKQNSGVSATRNIGLDNAKGEYISFCDSDDVLNSELYEKLFEKMKSSDVDRVCGGYMYLYPNGHTLYCKPRKPDGVYLRNEVLPMMIDDGTMSGFLFSGVNNSIFLKSIIDEYHIRFDESIRYNEDSLFSFEYARCSNGMYSFQSEPLYLYRQHNSSATKKRTTGDKYSSLRQKLKMMELDHPIVNFTLQMRRRMVTEAFWQILDISEKENGKRAIKYIKLELRKATLIDNLDSIDVANLNRYKRLYYIMMKHNMARTLYFTSKRFVPILSKYLSR